jgi:hypothetical protein
MRTTSPLTIGGAGSGRVRENVYLLGVYDGSSRIFSLPEPAIYDPPKRTVRLYHNGRRMLPSEYEVYENVPGGGYNMIRMKFTPQVTSLFLADYLAE